MDARFFIENSEVIGLWILLSLVFITIIEIIDYAIESFKSKREHKKVQKRKAIARQNQVQYENFRYNFSKQFNEYIVKF